MDLIAVAGVLQGRAHIAPDGRARRPANARGERGALQVDQVVGLGRLD